MHRWTLFVVGMLFLRVLPPPAWGAPEEAASSVGQFALKDVRVDHVLISVSPGRYAAMSDFLAREFGESWIPRDEEGKGFILARDDPTYIELWDFGGPGVNGPIGNQVAISGSNEEEGIRKARSVYGHEGMHWGEHGAPNLFTVGSEFIAGHPLGGTFFVSYGPSPPSTQNASSPVASLLEVVMALPTYRMGESTTYRALGFSERPIEGGIELTDSEGLTVHLIERPNADFMSFGPWALRFRIPEPVAEPRQVEIDASKTLKAVYQSQELWLVLRPDLFNPATDALEGR